MAITTDRNEYLPSHVTQRVKRAVRLEAANRSMSASALVFEILQERMRELGYEVDANEFMDSSDSRDHAGADERPNLVQKG
jgi:hypothetical protein